MEKSNFLLHFSQSFFYLFTAFGIIFIPFPFHLFSYQEKITNFVFGKIISSIKPYIFENSKYEQIVSDSSSLYILILLLVLIALIIQFIFRNHIKFKKYLLQVMNIVIPYYLSLILLKYGFDKVFMGQFYSPESNILYTPFGFLDKDILFWSTIGISPTFNLFLGLSQITTAFLLLFKKTRFFGFILAIFIFTNIVAINISFDISVKVFSIFLLFMSFLGLVIYKHIFIRIIKEIKTTYSKIYLLSKNNFLYAFLKSFVILLFLFEVLYLNIQKNTSINNSYSNFIGAYLVTETLEDNILIKNHNIKRFFIHKNGYFIFQNLNDQMTDYKLQIFKDKHQFVITDYNLKKTKINYKKKDSLLVLEFIKNNKKYQLKGKMLNTQSLPLFRDNLHWTIDEIK
ncbi:hypothetical protein [Aureivirga sp. CE67]|uniref:hypothetical protein n=1 Tax=Aureivirga sp. CE67 TaxID=1788983 RepID=UPI0018CBB033|nr:hypothetical protein [Aureivirga sp. CE67]